MGNHIQTVFLLQKANQIPQSCCQSLSQSWLWPQASPVFHTQRSLRTPRLPPRMSTLVVSVPHSPSKTSMETSEETAGQLTAQEPDGAMLTVLTRPAVRTLDSVPGSQTTLGHMRPVPLLCQDMLLHWLPRHLWLPSQHLTHIQTQLLHTQSKVELSPQEQVTITMVDSMATLVLLILVLSNHTVNIFQSLPTGLQLQEAVTLSNFKEFSSCCKKLLQFIDVENKLRCYSIKQN